MVCIVAVALVAIHDTTGQRSVVWGFFSTGTLATRIENSISSVFQLLYGVPLGPVLGPLLFILYTTPLSTIISSSSANHHLYMLMILNFSYHYQL